MKTRSRNSYQPHAEFYHGEINNILTDTSSLSADVRRPNFDLYYR
jgi:hypothetical protein